MALNLSRYKNRVDKVQTNKRRTKPFAFEYFDPDSGEVWQDSNADQAKVIISLPTQKEFNNE